MNKLIILHSLLLIMGLSNLCYSQNIPVINKAKQTFFLYMDNNEDTPLTYGYETTSLSSRKMICFSSFTGDVENNPHKCVLGAYYHTEDISIAYMGIDGEFVKLKFMGSENGEVIFYIEKKWVRFE